MRRIVFSFPFAIATFLIGVAAFALASVISYPLDRMAVVDVPPVIGENETASHHEVPYPTHCDDELLAEVYSVILKLDRYKSDRIVIEEFTERGGTLMGEMIARRGVKGAEVSTIEDYELKNRDSTSLRELFAGRNDIVFYTAKDDKAMSRDKNTPFEEKFAKRFPGSRRLVSLSDVGFNSQYTEALVYVAYYCGPLCAGGSFYVLKKTNGRWVVDHEIEHWVS